MSKKKLTSNNLSMETELTQRLAQKKWQGKLEILLFSNQLGHRAAVKEIVFFLTPRTQSLVILQKTSLK